MESRCTMNGDKAKRDSSREWRRDTACQGNQNQPVRGSKALWSTRNIVTDEERIVKCSNENYMYKYTYIYEDRERERMEKTKERRVKRV